jgi:hypothetical protein
MTSRFDATFLGGPLDGTTYRKVGGAKFAERLVVPVDGRTHLYLATADGKRVVYKHARAMTVEAVS